MLCSVLEGKGWWLQCDAICCIGRQRMGTAMWRYVLHWKAKDGDCNVTLCAVLEGKAWGLQCGAMCCVGRHRMGNQKDRNEREKKTWLAHSRAHGKELLYWILQCCAIFKGKNLQKRYFYQLITFDATTPYMHVWSNYHRPVTPIRLWIFTHMQLVSEGLEFWRQSRITNSHTISW